MSKSLTEILLQGGQLRPYTRRENIFERAKRKGTTFEEGFNKAVKNMQYLPPTPAYMLPHKVRWRWLRRKFNKRFSNRFVKLGIS